MPTCAGCKQVLPRRDYLDCSTCKLKYDLLCAAVPSKRFMTMKQIDKCSWKCPECRNKQPKTDNSNTPVRPTIQAPATAMGQVSISVQDKCEETITGQNETSTSDKQLDLNESFSGSELDHLQEMRLFRREMRATRKEMSNFSDTLVELKITMEKCNERMDIMEARIDSLECQISERDRTCLDAMEATITQLKRELLDHQQDRISNDVEIAGIPETKGEGITHIVLTVAKKLGVDLDERDIVSAERAGPVRAFLEGEPVPRPRAIAVRLARRERRDALLSGARVRRGATTAEMSLPGPERPFYINERLTKANRTLFRKARECASRCGWRYVWTRNGKVYARYEQGKERHRLYSEEDIERVFGKKAVSTGDNKN